ncbi:GGDEF domain-containing protein [Desulfurivibrio sp. D14AmB]|uniref:GGDEF domain-containing protein n=1 Tax=Desulfurivibrio sp. D14AmB TaxID=3374370 RepID=UPI00376ED818
MDLDAEKRVRELVLDHLRHPEAVEPLVDTLDRLVRREGEIACKVILELLVHRDFSREEAARYWQEIVAHRHMLSLALGREVTLYVAVCDYFSLNGNGVNHPKLVDVYQFESINSEKQFDFLTGVYNRKALETSLGREFSRAERHRRKLSVLFIDLDSFKEINDDFGHLVGDKVLRHVGKILTRNKRSGDIAARYGGDEFAMILPDTGKEEALVLAQRINGEVNRELIAAEGMEVRLTVSGGIATYPDDAASGQELLKCADEALLQAKRLGRNLVLAYRSEKRQAQRLALEAPLTITRIETSTVDFPPLRSKNLSRTGILLDCGFPISRGSLLEMEIVLKDRKLTVRGEVVRVEKMGPERFDIGVSFLRKPGRPKPQPRRSPLSLGDQGGRTPDAAHAQA